MIITISHQKGGVGKSTLAWHLAGHYLLNRDTYGLSSVSILDLDIQQSITAINKRRSDKLPQIEVLQWTINKLIANFDKIPYEHLVVIDLGGFDSDDNRKAIALSDVILTPVGDSSIELDGIRKYEEILRIISNRINTNITAKVVLNKINATKTNHSLKPILDYLKQSNHFEVLDSIVRNRTIFDDAITQGLFVDETKELFKFSNSNRLARKEIKSLAKELNDILKK